MFARFSALCAAILISLVFALPLRAEFDLNLVINSAGFTPGQVAVLQDSLDQAEALWESVITGYQATINLPMVTITISQGSSFAAGSYSGLGSAGGFTYATSGYVQINATVVDWFDSWEGTPGPTDPDPNFLGLNYVDDILAHEIGHALGFGTLWATHGLYVNNSYQYTGQYGVAAYRGEFDPSATFVPVENAGNPGTPNSHWDQIIRSSSEGNPSDPWGEDPRVGVTDPLGRDRALELMTGTLDPDYGEPFLSRTTIQSFRDLGYTVVPEPCSLVLSAVGLLMAFTRRKSGARNGGGKCAASSDRLAATR